MGLKKSMIDGVIRKHKSNFEYCYNKGLRRNPKLAGRIIVGFIINTRGGVMRPQIVSSNMDDPEVEDCILIQLRKLEFPRPEVKTPVRYPFTFARKK